MLAQRKNHSTLAWKERGSVQEGPIQPVKKSLNPKCPGGEDKGGGWAQ